MNYLQLSNVGEDIYEPRGITWFFRHPRSGYSSYMDNLIKNNKVSVELSCIKHDEYHNDIVVKCKSRYSKYTYYFMIDCSGNSVGRTIVPLREKDGVVTPVKDMRLSTFVIYTSEDLQTFQEWILELGNCYYYDLGCPTLYSESLYDSHNEKKYPVNLPDSCYDFESPFPRSVKLTDFI